MSRRSIDTVAWALTLATIAGACGESRSPPAPPPAPPPEAPPPAPEVRTEPEPEPPAWAAPPAIPVRVAVGGTGARRRGLVAHADATCAALDGQVLCWGAHRLSEGTAPRRVEALAGAEELAFGGMLCGRLPDGRVRCSWDAEGLPLARVADVAALGGAAQIAAGARHGCALRRDGRLFCWGDNSAGQLGDGTTEPRREPVEVAGLSPIVSLSAHGDATCVVRVGGELWCWGRGPHPALASPTRPVQLPEAAGVRAAVMADAHACVQRLEGTVACFGDARGGRLGGAPVDGVVAHNELPRIDEVAVGGATTCARSSDGAVFCWGDDRRGQAGAGGRRAEAAPTEEPVLTGATEVAVGASHACARRGGAILCWGDNARGQVTGASTAVRSPARVTALSDAVSVGVGETHACALTRAGRVACWGRIEGASPLLASAVPVEIEALDDVRALAVGRAHACALAGDEVRCFGAGERGQLGDGRGRGAIRPSRVRLRDPTGVAAAADHACAANEEGEVLCWGRLGDEDARSPRRLEDVEAVEIGASDAGGCARTGDGAVTCWSGAGPASPVDGLADARELSVGAGHACARRAGGEVVCWGEGPVGQLGRGCAAAPCPPSSSPIPLPGGAEARGFAATAATCLWSADRASCFGIGDDHRPRTPAGAVAAEPVALPVSDVVDVVVGATSCAVHTAGHVTCWGDNDHGQVGDGLGGALFAPRPVSFEP